MIQSHLSKLKVLSYWNLNIGHIVTVDTPAQDLKYYHIGI